jgi:predicted RND superfamily exporter protein
MKASIKSEVMPVIKDPKDFDPKTGTLAEQIVFNYRGVIIAICIVLTLVFGYFATTLNLNANFEKTIPTTHPYIKNYLAHKVDLAGLGNTVRLAVENTKGTIYDAQYLEVLQKINDEVFLVPGVDRMNMRSLWTPATTWTAVTEFGFDGGPVIGNGYDRSGEALQQIRRNVERSGKIGILVALNHKSSLISIPLLSKDTRTGGPIDYGEMGRTLEGIREKYQSDTIKIHITGFAKVMGDLIEGVQQVMFFFLIALLIATIVLYWYSRCPRSTITVMFCSIVAVIWQLGISAMLGKDLDPYSVLVPFLVFSIAMSHGAQKMNGILQDVGRGTHKLIAARYTFRRLFLAGLTALVSDTFGFTVLMLISIAAIRELAMIATVGVVVVIFTNLILVPLTLSYVGVSEQAAKRSLSEEQTGREDKSKHPLFAFLERFTTKKWAAWTVIVSIPLLIFAWQVRKDLRIGDLDRGTPELRADSRYNLDNDYMVENYGASSDVMAVMVTTPIGRCNEYNTLMKVDALEWILRQTEGVESTDSLALLNRKINTGLTEGSPKWFDLFPNQSMINFVTQNSVRGYANDSAEMLTIFIYLADHRADTLSRVVNVIETFAADNNTEDVKFLLAAGSSGIEAATNIVVKKANKQILFWVYTVVILMCFITFRSWRAVVCAILPLMLTSILAEALMAKMGIGVKVSTLPVVALGVGIGVDYALYILNVVQGHYRAGRSLSEAFYRADLFTGKVVLLIGVTLSVSVATWAWSPIKFQADMGLLLAFMFFVNMLGALLLQPALAYFLYPKVKKERVPASTSTNTSQAVLQEK